TRLIAPATKIEPSVKAAATVVARTRSRIVHWRERAIQAVHVPRMHKNGSAVAPLKRTPVAATKSSRPAVRASHDGFRTNAVPAIRNALICASFQIIAIGESTGGNSRIAAAMHAAWRCESRRHSNV